MSQFVYLTSEEFARSQFPNKRTELVRGRLVVREPAKPLHGLVAGRLIIEIGIYLRSNPIGEAFAAETGFTLARRPDTVRAGDVSYLRSERVPTEEVVGFDEIAPDLVAEVLSRGDRTRTVDTKVGHWLRAGSLLVWVIDPRKRHARVYRQDRTTSLVTDTGALDGEDVLPGFKVTLTRLLDG
jgi:Uma2 family endonuclease